MQQTPPEVAITYLAFQAFWILVIVAIVLLGQRWKRVRIFREKMVSQWKSALVIAAIYFIAGILGAGFNPGQIPGLLLGMIGIFCMALIGVTLARSVGSFEPLPVAQSLIQGKRIWSRLGWSIGVALLAVPITIILNLIGTAVAHIVFHETIPTTSGSTLFPMSKWMVFFQLLAGAGIFEETIFRLLILSLVWWLTGRRWLAILLSAVAFGAYHLSPLDGFYLVFWHYPVTQFLSTAFIGILWGFIYTWRGYETAVLSHTLSDWLPFMLFT